MFFGINDVLTAWDQLSGNVMKITGSKGRGASSVDHSFITPMIIALGEFPETKIEDVKLIVQGDPVVIWNLSGKPLHPACKNAFQNQIIDVTWRTPCRFTSAPVLDCVFSLCLSIKSWSDLNERNLAMIHCRVGQPSTGILIACLLKYIGAFEHAVQAYNFYCNKRLKGDPNQNLAPSYRTLFENVDKVVDSGGYKNPFPIHLKTLTIAGLPVEEMPCVEVWDLSGNVFTSHKGFKHSSMCTWNSEYGDGFYRISEYIIGDFAIICRFGGHLSNTRDKSTLIFKYQNTTAFLPSDLVELKFHQVDINPKYEDSIDVETFTIHLMLEASSNDPSPLKDFKPFKETKDQGVAESKVGGERGKKGPLCGYFELGVEGFEAGLDEISKLHSVVPDTSASSELLDLSTSSSLAPSEHRYLSVALQLSNNNVPTAKSLVDMMHRHHQSLLRAEAGDSEDKGEKTLSVSDWTVEDSSWEVVDLTCNVCQERSDLNVEQEISCSFCGRCYHTYCVGLRKIPFTGKTEKEQGNRERYVKTHFGTWRCPTCADMSKEAMEAADQAAILLTQGMRSWTSLDTSVVPEAEETRDLKAGRFLSPNKSLNHLEEKLEDPEQDTKAEGEEGMDPTKMVFTVQNDIKKNTNSMMSQPSSRRSYGVSTSGGGVIVTDQVRNMTSPTGQLLSLNRPNSTTKMLKHSQGAPNENTSPIPTHNKHMPSPAVKTKHDQVAALLGLLATNNLGIDELLSMSEEKQKETLVAIVSGKNKDKEVFKDEKGNLDLATALKGLIHNRENLGTTPAPSPMKPEKESNDPAPLGRLQEVSNNPSRLSAAAIAAGLANKSKPSLGDSRQNMLNALMKRNLEGGMGSSRSPDRKVAVPAIGNPELVAKRLQEQKMILEAETRAAQQNSELSDAYGRFKEVSSESSGEQIRVKDIPQFLKFFKMLKVGIPKKSLAEKLVAEGICPNEEKAMQLLNMDPESVLSKSFFDLGADSLVTEKVLYPRNTPGGSAVNSLIAQQLNGGEHNGHTGGGGNSGFVGGAPMGGRPGGVKGVVPAGLAGILMAKAGNTDPAKAPAATKAPEGKQEDMVPAAEHPKYARFFKMLKIGLGKEVVQQKMQMEGVDPSMIEKAPTELIPLNEAPKAAAKGSGEMVKAGEHPKYAKYFKMLKVGLPIDAVKSKMEQDGLKSAVLDKDPNDMIPLNDEVEEGGGGGGPMVKVSEHPKYAKFFKMLKVGLPPPAVKTKMQQEGVNPDMLDKPPDEMIPLNDEVDDGPTIAVSEHPMFQKFFKMLKVGLPKDAVKVKMQQEGFDPSFLDKDPTEKVSVKDPTKASSGKKVEKKREAPKIRKKKLHWKALDASKLTEGSLWADNTDVDIMLDEAEFNKLFVQGPGDQDQETKKPKVLKEPKKQKVTLIDMKRAQNGGIALARIKSSYEDIKKRIMNMMCDGFTTDQLKSLEEFLPTAEESGKLKKYSGDLELLGQAERYMIVMDGFKSAPKRIKCMIYKQQFKSRVHECKVNLSRIENACDDVKLSARLKKVLKTVLKVGNQLNDGEEHKGFTLDSLLKLQSAKAFDKKTTVLQYVIMLIYRNDQDALLFPDDLKNVSAACRITMDTIKNEKNMLKDEFDKNSNIVLDIQDKEPESDIGAMLDFLSKAETQCKELEKSFDSVLKKFAGVLAYFGESSEMTTVEFFSTLDKFINEFKGTCEAVERIRKAEQKRLQQEKDQEIKDQKIADGTLEKRPTISRRRSMQIMPATEKKSLKEGPAEAPAGAKTVVKKKEKLMKKSSESSIPPPTKNKDEGKGDAPPERKLVRRRSSMV